jgi:hypothetical protein
MADRLEFVAYCGLHCDLCAARSRIPQRAAALQKAMADEGWTYWEQNVPGFEVFWKFLADLRADGAWPLDQRRDRLPFDVGQAGQANKWLTLDALRVIRLLGSTSGQDPVQRP